MSRRATVLAWHRVCEGALDPWNLCVTPDTFGRQLAHLRGSCQVMDLVELVAAATRQRLPERALALTFDDGYAEMLDVAQTLAGLPATFFVAVEPRGGEPWWDALARAVLETAPAGEHDLGPGLPRLVTRTAGDRRLGLDARHAFLLQSPLARRSATLQRVRDACGAAAAAGATHRTLSVVELRRLAALPGVAIGGHGVHHLALPALSHEGRRDEIALCGLRLASLLGRAPLAFAYPFGMPSDDAPRLAREAGYRVAVTTRAGSVDNETDPHLVPRFEITDATTVADLERLVAGLAR